MARKKREREGFAHVKRSRRARLVKRSLRLWQDFVSHVDAEKEQLADGMCADRDWAELDAGLDLWREQAAEDDEASSQLFAQHSMAAWLDGVDEGARDAQLADDVCNDHGGAETMSRWMRWQVQLSGRQRMAGHAQEQNDRKLMRGCFDGWTGLARPVESHQYGLPHQTPGSAKRGGRLVAIYRRDGGGGGQQQPQQPQQTHPAQPRTPWTAPALPTRNRTVRIPGRRQLPNNVTFEAGDPDEDDAGGAKRGFQYEDLVLRPRPGQGPQQSPLRHRQSPLRQPASIPPWRDTQSRLATPGPTASLANPQSSRQTAQLLSRSVFAGLAPRTPGGRAGGADPFS